LITKSEDNNNLYFVECNNCGETEDFEAPSWKDLIKDMKDLGWVIFKVGEEWQHLCVNCSRKAAE